MLTVNNAWVNPTNGNLLIYLNAVSGEGSCLRSFIAVGDRDGARNALLRFLDEAGLEQFKPAKAVSVKLETLYKEVERLINAETDKPVKEFNVKQGDPYKVMVDKGGKKVAEWRASLVPYPVTAGTSYVVVTPPKKKR